jgi:hypothetical protein
MVATSKCEGDYLAELKEVDDMEKEHFPLK